MGDDTGAQIRDTHAGAEESVVLDEERAAVRKILATLPPKERQLLEWLFFEERDKDEICRTLGIDRSYLRVLLHRAKQRFKARVRRRHETVRRLPPLSLQKTMTHQQALDTMAAERYLLDEMTEIEKHAFEEHFFDCDDCAHEVRLGEQIRVEVRSVPRFRAGDSGLARPGFERHRVQQAPRLAPRFDRDPLGGGGHARTDRRLSVARLGSRSPAGERRRSRCRPSCCVARRVALCRSSPLPPISASSPSART